MANLLNNTDIATLFLDIELRVRRFTPQTAQLIKLIPSDAGRPITDIVTVLDYPRLAEDAREALRSRVVHQQQVSARDGRWFTLRIMPYRTQDNRIDGVVITFVDIGATKSLETTCARLWQCCNVVSRTKLRNWMRPNPWKRCSKGQRRFWKPGSPAYGEESKGMKPDQPSKAVIL